MTIYLLNYLTIPLYFACFRVKPDSERCRKIIAFICFQMFLIMAFRDEKLGSDVAGYAKYYAHWAGYSFREMLLSTRFVVNQKIGWGLESGYVWLCWICAQIGCSFHTFLVIHSAICMIGLYTLVTRYSDSQALSLAVIVSFGVWTTFFYILRQSLAFVAAVWAFHYAVEKKRGKFILASCLAVLFHRAALVFFLLYPFIKKRINQNIIAVFSALVLITPFLMQIMSPLYRRFMDYIGKDYELGAVYYVNNMTICMLILFATTIILSKHYSIFNDPKVNMAGWCFMLAILLEELSPYVPTISRIPIYFLFPFGVLSFSTAVEKMPTRNRTLVKAACYTILFGFFIYVIRYSSTVPYVPAWK